MKTGFRGTFVISWSQTEIDSLDAAPVEALRVGAAWGWRGDVVRVDGPTDVLRLDQAEGADALRQRAARMVQRLVGAALDQPACALRGTPEDRSDLPLMDNSFLVTEGSRCFVVTLIETGAGKSPLLMFHDALPPRNRELWVVKHTLRPVTAGHAGAAGGGVICFTPGTRIATPTGNLPIETLSEGDLVLTRDNGPQPIRWIGSRHMTGARLLAMPELRPVRLRAGSLLDGRPEGDLLVSPEHRLLIRGVQAQALFNTSEVLVAARDLIDDRGIAVDRSLREVSYIHMLLEQHQILWANGVPTESFHPASARLSALDDSDRERLLRFLPEVETDPHAYGDYARRSLTTSEAAILRHAA